MLRVNHLSGFGRIVPAVGGGFDSDAQAFFTATGISDSTIQSAVDALVVGLKADGIWAKLQAIYPMVGGTSTTHKYNLKDPQDTDGAFRLTFSGTVTHDTNGVTGNGTDGYATTHLNQNTHTNEDDEHMSCYSRTDAQSNGFAMGVTGADAASGTRVLLRSTTNNFATRSQNSATSNTSNTSSLGYFSNNRTASTGYRKRVNATNTDVTADSDFARISQPVYVMARNANGSASGFNPYNFAWFALGRGLTETEDGNLRTRVETFQDALSRGVV